MKYNLDLLNELDLDKNFYYKNLLTKIFLIFR